jgi:hypothetical protein
MPGKGFRAMIPCASAQRSVATKACTRMFTVRLLSVFVASPRLPRRPDQRTLHGATGVRRAFGDDLCLRYPGAALRSQRGYRLLPLGIVRVHR